VLKFTVCFALLFDELSRQQCDLHRHGASRKAGPGILKCQLVISRINNITVAQIRDVPVVIASGGFVVTKDRAIRVLYVAIGNALQSVSVVARHISPL